MRLQSTFGDDSHSIDKVILWNIGSLVLHRNAINFRLPTSVAIGDVSRIYSQAWAFGENTKDFFLYNSTYHYFDLETFIFAQSIKDFNIEESRFGTATKVGNDPNPTMLELGYLDGQMVDSFKIINTTFDKFLEGNFIKVNSHVVDLSGNSFELSKKDVFHLKGVEMIIQANKMVLLGSKASFHVDGVNISFTENRIYGKNQNLIKIIPFNSLLIRENDIFDQNFEILELLFPETEISRLSIINSDFGRLTSSFLNVLSDTVVIQGSSLSLDNEDIFFIETRNLFLTNNTFQEIKTGAIKSNVMDSVLIADNSFDHPQRECFFFIEPIGNMTTMLISGNRFENVENGFLKLNPGSIKALEDGRLSFGSINLKKSCSCSIAHDLIVPDKVSNLNNSQHENDEHNILEDAIKENIVCISNGKHI